MDNTSETKEELILGYSQSDIIDVLVDFGISVLIALIILLVGFRLARFLSKITKNVLEKRDSDQGLITFMGSLVNGIVKILTVITAFSQLGIEMTSFIAILGAAGLAIGMAFSGTLSNLAGGVMLLIFKPIKVDEYIHAQGEGGTVKEIQIFHTILLTPDNKTIILPNGPLSTGNITNFSRQDTRRVDFTFGFAYGENLKLAKETILEVINSHPQVFEDPEPFVKLGALGDSSVNLTVRIWSKKEDYWDIHFYVNEKVYEKFEETEGLSIPFPQMDVHLEKSE